MNRPDKEKIFYTRTYRRMKLNLKQSLIFVGVAVLPVLLIFLIYLEKLIQGVIKLSRWVLSQVIPVNTIKILSADYSGIWTIEYIDLPTKYPQFLTVLLHLTVCMVILAIMNWLRKTGRPMAIFLLYCMFIHVVNCVFFLFALDALPYTIGDYSELYLKQQIGIWIMFIVMAGVVLGSWGSAAIGYRIAAFAGICAYSLLFGTVRYILFLFILYRFSVIYMAIMFFVIGPMVDFAYFVMIYAAFMNKMTQQYESGNKRGEWGWS